jgi:hypothetical protein
MKAWKTPRVGAEAPTCRTRGKPTSMSIASTQAGFGPQKFDASLFRVAAGVEHGGGPRVFAGIEMRFDDELAPAERPADPEVAHGILGVIEHPEEEHDVECPETVSGQILDVTDHRLRAGVEDAMGEVKTVLSKGWAGRIDPALIFDGHDPGGPPALRLEGEEPVPGADVEHAQPVESLWELAGAELRVRVVAAGRDDAVAEVDFVPPRPGLDEAAEFSEIWLSHDRANLACVRAGVRGMTSAWPV